MRKTRSPTQPFLDPLDERLDEALTETFPASDPIAVDPTARTDQRNASDDRARKAKRAATTRDVSG